MPLQVYCFSDGSTMQLIASLTLVDWLMVACLLLLVALFMASDAGSVAQYRRPMAYSILLLAGTMAWVLATTDAGSFIFGTFTEDSEAITKRKKAKQAMHATDKNQAGQDPSGPGDGDGGGGEDMELALAGVETPDKGGGIGAGAKQKGNRAGGGNSGGGSLKAEAPAGEGGGETDDISEDTTKDEDGNLTRRDCAKCPVMALIPAGSQVLGGNAAEPGFRPHEAPLKRVTFEKAFWLGRYEVTRAEYQDFVRATGHRTRRGCVVQYKMRSDYGFDQTGLSQDDTHPAICVSWLDAKAYVAWLAKTTGKPFRLPSEAEWEYAARGGQAQIYPWGNEIAPEDANFAAFTRNTMPVGRYKANGFGLFDMAGNVWEWVEDCWSPDRMTTMPDGLAYTTPGCRQRVLKGGSWYNTAPYLRPAARWANPTGSPGNGVGFRVARGVVEKKVAAATAPIEPEAIVSPVTGVKPMAAPVPARASSPPLAPKATKKAGPAKRADAPPPLPRFTR